MPSQSQPRVWALLGPRRGDNNQVLALAEALELPFEEKWLSYNALRRVPPLLLGASFASVAADARAQLDSEVPDLTISTGLRSVPVVRELKRRSGGRMVAVHLGYPRVSPRHFDLVVPTPEYPVPDARNVLRIPFALSPHATRAIEPDDAALLEPFPRPRRLLLIGGPTFYWELPAVDVVAAVRRLLAQAKADGGSLLAVGSPRTPEELIAAVAFEMNCSSVPSLLVPGDGPPAYPALIEAADTIFVTADSVAMVADAVMTGKPVGLVTIAKSPLGRAVMGVMDLLRPGRRLRPRDLRFFWAALRQERFGGTLEDPRASKPPDYAAMVADRIMRLLALPAEPATNGRDSGG